jgi:hypothetical protein
MRVIRDDKDGIELAPSHSGRQVQLGTAIGAAIFVPVLMRLLLSNTWGFDTWGWPLAAGIVVAVAAARLLQPSSM